MRGKPVGFQYYSAAIESTRDTKGDFRRFLAFDFVYSSACPCSAELGCKGVPNGFTAKVDDFRSLVC